MTAAILRIMRKPEAVKTMLAVFASLEDAGNVVSAIVAAGLVPATLELMDSRTIIAIEDAMACGFPRDAAAVLLIELDGLKDGMDDLAEQITASAEANHALEVRVAQDEDERAALWRGRQGSFRLHLPLGAELHVARRGGAAHHAARGAPAVGELAAATASRSPACCTPVTATCTPASSTTPETRGTGRRSRTPAWKC